jgi:hypothetical protein
MMFSRRWFAFALVSYASSAWAQESAPAPTRAPLPPLQVIDGLEVRRGQDTTIYERVVPPVLPPRPPAPARAAVETQAVPLTAEQQRREAKKAETLLVMATVYDHRVTELRWQQDGRERRAWSSIDFNHLAGVTEIETAGTIYQWLLALANLTAAEVEANNRAMAEQGLPAKLITQLPPPEQFRADRSSYLLVEDSAGPAPAEVTALLEALHTYYDAHRASLIEQSTKFAAVAAARAEAARLQAAQPKRTVIQFWRAEGVPAPAPK